jgi:CheY-like chemotaxis protein
MKSSSVNLQPAPVLLLVDDNLNGSLARKSVLEELGYEVHTVMSAEDALQYFETRPANLMVTDFKLPKMDGRQLIVEIRRTQPDLRIILLTGFADSLGLHESNTGADAVLMKNAVEVKELVRTVKRLLTAKRKPAGKANAAAAGAGSTRAVRKKR